MPGGDDSAASRRPPVVLITGASAGLGAALARELARRKKARSLVLTARRADRLGELATELNGLDPALEILSVAADLADPATPARLAAQVVSRFGGLDALINNAGLGLPTLFADAEPGHLARQLSVNFVAPLLLTRLCLPSLIERKGMIINIGSAITCAANSALGAYGATKSGVAYWNDALRRELHATGVRVCLVEPGPIRTEFTDALTSLVPAGGRTAPILDNAAPWMSVSVEEVAGRVIDLIDHPRRRISVPKRLIWPLRFLGALTRLCPPFGDRIVRWLQR
jgi:short-subunit dehydrogenase